MHEHLPIGTILTVPINFYKFCNNNAWIDYVDDLAIDIKYPELAKALAVKTLPKLLNKVYVGELKYGLTGNSNGSWKQWGSIFNIQEYPELDYVVKQLINYLPFGSKERLVWENAYLAGCLPNIDSLFISCTNGLAGIIKEGSNGNAGSYHYPMIEHTDDILKPLGRTSTQLPKTVYPSITGENVHKSNVPANLVLLAQRPSIHVLEEPAMLVHDGNGNSGFIGYPNNISANLFVNTETYSPHVPKTHKIIIKTC